MIKPEIPRLDINTDRKLKDRVCSSIRSMCYRMFKPQEGETVDADALIDSLRNKGYDVRNDEQSVRPYMGYWYSSDSLTLIRLNNSDCCIRRYGESNFSLCWGKSDSSDVTLQDISTANALLMMETIDNSLPELIAKEQEQIIKEVKRAKQITINKTTVDTVVKATLKGSGIKYKLSLSDHSALLILQLQHGLETRIQLSYKDFMNKIPHIRSTVERLNSIMDELGQPLRIKSTYYREKDIWTESE